MPKIECWDNLPEGVRQHLIDRIRDRAITITDLNQLRVWIESKPEVPEGDWYKDFGSFKICGHGSYPKTFLLRGQAAKGEFDAPPELPRNPALEVSKKKGKSRPFQHEWHRNPNIPARLDAGGHDVSPRPTLCFACG